MEADKLEILLGKYYSGDILPDEYQHLLSLLKNAGELTPELETERSFLLAIESCEAAEPDGLEDRLVMAINNHCKRRHSFLRMVYLGSAAAIALVFITTVLYFQNEKPDNTFAPIAKIYDAQEGGLTAETSGKEGLVGTLQVTSMAQENSVSHSVSSEDLAKSVQMADEALLEVLASIHLAQNEVIDAIDNIEISQTSDYIIL